MKKLHCPSVYCGNVLLPKEGTDMQKWAVIACDQHTADHGYWEKLAGFVGDTPSTLQLTLPEIYLEEPDAPARIEKIHQAMAAYLQQGILRDMGEGFVYVRRQTLTGLREGLVICIDLEDYDFTPGTTAFIRATEGTIVERIPPRVRIRRGAPIELPHIMLLFDDPKDTVFGALRTKAETKEACYQTPLYGGGDIQGYFIDDQSDIDGIDNAFGALIAGQVNPMLFAVGDGNHSLATAKAWWEECKKTLSAAEAQNHPARYCLVEAVNLHDKSLDFEPIHRVIFDIDAIELGQALENAAQNKKCKLLVHQEPGTMVPQDGWQMLTKDWRVDVVPQKALYPLPVGTLQMLLDEVLPQFPNARIDYIHGSDAVRNLCSQPNTVGFLLPAMHKQDLFPSITSGGVLPRKTFSMGEAQDKRFYLESRKIL